MKIMDSSEKKRLANEKRLKAIQEWKKNRNQQPIKIEPKSVRKIFEDPSLKSNDINKLTLFDSEEEEEDNCEDDFRIRPQFEGENGQYLLEKNSELSSRFKLDERFKDDNEEISEIIATEEQEEKSKNMKILESVLGYEVIEKYPDGQKSMERKKMLRFDPDDEDASELVGSHDISVAQPPKKIRKKQAVMEETNEKQEIPISTERYVEVSSNLKDLLNSSATPFSLTEKFSTEIEIENNTGFSFSFPTKEDLKLNEVTQKEDIKTSETKNIFETGKKFLFFISENDDLLKEGVNFFQRKSTLEELYEDWNKRKAGVMELFRKKKKTFQRGFVTRIKASEKNKAYAKK